MSVTILHGDCRETLKTLPDESVQCCVTSPPYFGLRDYGHAGQIGMEATPEAFVAELVIVFREVRRVLRKDGTLWLNLGDSYNSVGVGYDETGSRGAGAVISAKTQAAVVSGRNRNGHSGLKTKDLIGIPWSVAFALRADGWWLRQDIIWSKPNPMPESVQGSHFSRHRVTVEEYENLSGMQYEGERAGDEWAGDMPRLSEVEIPMRKAPLSAKRGGQGRRKSAGGTRRRKGEAATIQPIEAGENQQGEIRRDAKGEADEAQGSSQIQSEPSRQSIASRAASENEGDTKSNNATTEGQQSIPKNAEGESEITTTARAKEGRCAALGQAINGTGLGGDNHGGEGAMLLLQEEEEVDDGSRNPSEQRGAAHQGERGSGVPTVQQHEEQQPLDAPLVGCPGCPKCEKYHGYLYHLSAGRCTKAHEYIFMLTKSAQYFYDAAAIRNPATESLLKQIADGYEGEDTKNYANGGAQSPSSTKSRIIEGARKRLDKQSGHSRRHAGFNGRWDALTREEQCAVGSNKRSVWTVATKPFKGAHFATFPADLIMPCILAGTKSGDVVLDCFGGSGTTAQVSIENGRSAILCEINEEYLPMIDERTNITPGLALT